MLEIRQETKKDYEEVYNVVKTAFETAEHSDGNEHNLVVALRRSDNFIPELSFVAIEDNKIVGYILFTKIKIGDYEEIALLCYHYSVVLGSENYYPKFNYIPAIQYGIKAPFEVPQQNFMAIKLIDTEIEIKGTVEYAKEFGI